MENIKGKVQSSINDISNKGQLLVTQTLNLEGKQVYKKIFDNMIWVFVLIGLLILVYLSYLLTKSFNIDQTIQNMNREYKVKKVVSLDTPSESGQEERFDEIDIEKHTICDTFICSSAKSYLSGRQYFDYVSKQMFFQNIKFGARYVELDLFENNKGNIVVSNGLFNGNWRLTMNEIFFEDFCREIPTKVFNKEYTSNFQDPFIIFLGLNLPKKKMNLVAKIIEEFMDKSLLSKKYVVSGKENLFKLKLKDLMGKIIFITDGKIANTNLLNYIHLRVGSKVRKISYSQLLLEDKERLKEFNKHHITIVTPDPDISSMNYNPEPAFDTGCQIISLNFQYVSDHMKAYLSKFREKSFLLKPFEFTAFSDIPQKGYDPKRIAYYNNYEILKKKNLQGTFDKSGSKINDYRKDDDSIFFKNKLGTPAKENLKDGCCKLFVDDDDVDSVFPKYDLDLSISGLLNKINKLGEKTDRMVNVISQANTQDELKDIAKILNLNSLIVEGTNLNPQELKYHVLVKQLKKILQNKREEMFKSGMKDPCVKNLKDDKCSSNPMCYMDKTQYIIYKDGTREETYKPERKCNDDGRIVYKNSDDSKKLIKNKDDKKYKEHVNDQEVFDFETACNASDGQINKDSFKFKFDKCESTLSNIPYPKLCVPKYVSPNRNMCLSSEKDKIFIDSKGVRQIFHEKMTQPGFSGKWNSYLGPIVISDEFNSQCEFSFTTKHDDKIFTLFLVDWESGDYFLATDSEYNFIGKDNSLKLRAKGTFVDPMLRNLEKKHNLPELPYHGYVELKMNDFTVNKYNSVLRQCKNNKFIGIYRYSDKVFSDSISVIDDDDDDVDDDEKKIKTLYTNLINKVYENYDDKGLVLGYDEPLTGNESSPNIYCYKILSDECLDGSLGPPISFDKQEVEPPSFIYAPAAEEIFSTDKLVEMTQKMGLTFTEEELDANPNLRQRIIGMVQVERPKLVEEVEEEVKEEKRQEEERKQKAKEEEKKEVITEANLFQYHISSASSATLRKPGDTFRIMGPNNVPYCIQRKMADFSITECDNGKCDVSTAYIGPCKNAPNVEDPFCSNIDAAHNVQFVNDGTTGDNRTQTIRFLNNGTGDNPIDACLSYDGDGKVVYGNCTLNKNVDESIKNEWKVYKKEGDTKFKLTSADGRCLTRSAYQGKKPEELEHGLYQREAFIDTLFASATLQECKDELKDHQEFDIKYMGDTQNCDSPNDFKSMPVVNMEARSMGTPRENFKYQEGDKQL